MPKTNNITMRDVEGVDDGLLDKDPPPSTVQPVVPGLNAYLRWKIAAEGMLDIALLSANVNQLRSVLETGAEDPYYKAGLILIGLSMAFQILVGIGLIWNSFYNGTDQGNIKRASKINFFTVMGIFIITVLNIIISGLGIAVSSTK